MGATESTSDMVGKWHAETGGMRSILALLAILVAALPAAATAFAWPDGRKVAIVLTYDDALKSQLDIAAPQLRAAGLRGTFFLNGTFAPGDVPRWRALSKAGHELANHSLFHPCPRASFPMEAQFNTENYSITGMLREIAAMNTTLAAIDGDRPRTYSVPCSISLAGGKDYTDALRASGLARYVRTGVATGGVVREPAALDPYRVPSRSFSERATAGDLIAFVREVQRDGGLGIFMFHGVGGDYLSVSAEAHRGLLDYLRAHSAEIWVAPFQDVMDKTGLAASR